MRADGSAHGRSVVARCQRRLEVQAAVGPLGGVVPGELVEHGAQVRLAEDEDGVEALVAQGRTTRSASAFARGARTGVSTGIRYDARSVAGPAPAGALLLSCSYRPVSRRRSVIEMPGAFTMAKNTV